MKFLAFEPTFDPRDVYKCIGTPLAKLAPGLGGKEVTLDFLSTSIALAFSQSSCYGVAF